MGEPVEISIMQSVDKAQTMPSQLTGLFVRMFSW